MTPPVSPSYQPLSDIWVLLRLSLDNIEQLDRQPDFRKALVTLEARQRHVTLNTL